MEASAAIADRRVESAQVVEMLQLMLQHAPQHLAERPALFRILARLLRRDVHEVALAWREPQDRFDGAGTAVDEAREDILAAGIDGNPLAEPREVPRLGLDEVDEDFA